jgi:hypothetical protein
LPFDTTFIPTMKNEWVKKGTTSTFNQTLFDTITHVPTMENECIKWWKSKKHVQNIDDVNINCKTKK